MPRSIWRDPAQLAKNLSGRPIPAKATTGTPAKRAPSTAPDSRGRSGNPPRAPHRLDAVAEQHDRIGAGEPRRHRLAQWSAGITGCCRSHIRHRRRPARDPSRSSGFEAVIEQDDSGSAATASRTPAARSRATQHGARPRAIAPRRRPPLHRAARVDRTGPPRRRHSARHDMDGDAARRDRGGEGQHDRRLPRAAGDEIADADHRDRAR